MPEEKKEENLEELKKQLLECQKQKEEYLAGWQRARADFLNHKKEEMERVSGLLVYAQEELILKLLSVLDNFDVAEKKLPEDLKKDENVKGLLLIKNQLLDFLKGLGLEEIKSIGEKFDANLHEAVGETETEEKDSGVILEEIQKGYTIQGRVLRPARVKISK